MIILRRVLLLFSFTISINPLFASDEFAPPLKGHQLLTSISGYHLRDPRNGSESFDKACTRLENVMEQKVPNAMQPVDTFLTTHPLMILRSLDWFFLDRFFPHSFHGRTKLVDTLENYRGPWIPTPPGWSNYGLVLSPKPYAYPWHIVALIRNLQILPLEQWDVAEMWQSAMKSFGHSLTTGYKDYETGAQLVYAKRMYTLAQQEVFARALTNHALNSSRAFAEDGQSESFFQSTDLNSISSVTRIIPELNFTIPSAINAPLSDQLDTYTQAYKALAFIQNSERELLTKTLDQTCPYKMSPAEKIFIQEHFTSLSKQTLQDELEALPTILWLLSDLSAKNIRYVDLLCCRPDNFALWTRPQLIKRLSELCMNVKDKHILAKVREQLPGQ